MSRIQFKPPRNAEPSLTTQTRILPITTRSQTNNPSTPLHISDSPLSPRDSTGKTPRMPTDPLKNPTLDRLIDLEGDGSILDEVPHDRSPQTTPNHQRPLPSLEIPNSSRESSPVPQRDRPPAKITSSNQHLVKTENINIPSALCPEMFSGTSNEDAPIWWRRFGLFSNVKGWSDNQSLQAFPLFLKGAAAIWYDSLGTEQRASFAQLSQAFKDRYFPDPTMRWARLDEFATRTQKARESVQDYTQDVLKKGHDLGKSEQELVEALVRGFRRDIRRYVMEKDPSTIEQVIRFAKMAQAFSESTPETEGIAELAEQMKELKHQLAGEMAAIKSATVAAMQTDFSGRSPIPRQPIKQHTFRNTPTTRQTFHNSTAHPEGNPRQQTTCTPVPHYGQRSFTCASCAGPGHRRSDCRFRDYKCAHCGVIGHIARACRKRAQPQI